MEVSRPGPDETVKRKASEHKSPYEDDTASLDEMENTAWPEWEQTPYNWFNYGGYPGYEYYPPYETKYAGWGPISRYNLEQPYPDEAAEILLYLKGCALYGPSIITDCTKTYSYRFGFLAGNIVSIKIEGSAELISPKLKKADEVATDKRFNSNDFDRSKFEESSFDKSNFDSSGFERTTPTQAYIPKLPKYWNPLGHVYFDLGDKYPPDIIIKPSENASYGSVVTITVYTKLVQNDMLYDGWCQKKISVSCCGCPTCYSGVPAGPPQCSYLGRISTWSIYGVYSSNAQASAAALVALEELKAAHPGYDGANTLDITGWCRTLDCIDWTMWGAYLAQVWNVDDGIPPPETLWAYFKLTLYPQPNCGYRECTP